MTRHRLLLSAPVALLSLGAIVALLLADVASLAHFRKARAYADRTSVISIKLQKTMTAMVEAETASRGFLLTGDAGYLDSFEQAERAMPQTFAMLRGLASDSRLQLRRVAELDRMSTERTALRNETSRFARAGHIDAAIAEVREGTGKRLMNGVRQVASEMAAYEDGLLSGRMASAQHGYHLAMVVLGLAGVALLGLGAILFAIDRDIQKRRALERSLVRAVRARERMLAVVSNDLRNPLSVVMMAAKVIERGASPDPSGERLRKQARVISNEIERMSRLVVDLLDVSKIEAGGSLHIELARRDGATLLKQSVELLEPLTRARALTLAVDASPGMYHLDCDAARMHQLFSNLIGNATEFTPVGGSITARVARSKGDIVFSISNTGTGIPPAQVLHIFDPYWQTSSSRSGAGLGFSIVKAIVQAHRGRIWVETEVGAGSTFYCALPAAARNEAPQVAASKPRETKLMA